MEINKVGVIGAGVMGLGIAQVCAMAGVKTILFDINEEVLYNAEKSIESNLNKALAIGKLSEESKNNTLALLNYETILENVKVDLIIEAIIEKLEVKIKLFNQLAEINSTNAIFASNTSSIPITQIASKIPNPERVIGIHFFNPAHIMKLVEIICAAHTSPEVISKCVAFVKKINKEAILAKDSPGFIVNRVARHYYVESLKIVEEQVTDFETLDILLENAGFKMGAFKLMDLIGVETNYSVTNSMFEQFNFDSKFRPNRIQKQKVDAGFWGKKTKKGFYTYE